MKNNELINFSIAMIIAGLKREIKNKVSFLKKNEVDPSFPYVEVRFLQGIEKSSIDYLNMADVVDYVRKEVKEYIFPIEEGFFVASNHIISYDKAHDPEVFDTLKEVYPDANPDYIYFEGLLLIGKNS